MAEQEKTAKAANSSLLLVGEVKTPLTLTEVDVNGKKKTVGKMTVFTGTDATKKDGTPFTRRTYYEVNTWNAEQQEFLQSFKEGDGIVINGRLSSHMYEKEGNKNISLQIVPDDENGVARTNVKEGTQVIAIKGNIVRDAELKETSNGVKVARATVAVNDGKDNATFYVVEAWDDKAQAFADKCKKGDFVSVKGDVNLSTFKKEDGSFGSQLKIDHAKLCTLKSAESKKGAENTKSANAQSSK